MTKSIAKEAPAALEVARRQLAELNSGPLDYSRIVVNTHLRKDQIVDASKLRVDTPDAESFLSQNHVRLAAIFSNYPTQEAETRHLLDYVNQRGKPQATLKDRRVAGFHLSRCDFETMSMLFSFV